MDEHTINMKAYSKANCWLINDLAPTDIFGHTPGLLFKRSTTKEWKHTHAYRCLEFKTDVFECTDFELACVLVAKKYARIMSYNRLKKSVILHMRREY